MLEFYTRREVAQMLGISLPKASEVFHRAEFPALILGREMLVEKEAFKKWCSSRHTNDDYK